MMHTAVFYATHSFFRKMKTIEIFFSPTGGTRKVCDALTRAIDNGEPTVIDMAKPEWTNSVQHIVPTDCLAVIAAPSFAGRVPSTMAARMAQVRAEGGKAVIVCVYGNRAYDDTLVELQDLAEQSGFTVVAAVAAIAEHSVVRQYATGRPDSDDMAMLTDFANKIKFKLSSGKYSVPQIPGNRPYREVKPSLCPCRRRVAHNVAYVRGNVPYKPSTTTMCHKPTRHGASCACDVSLYAQPKRDTYRNK